MADPRFYDNRGPFTLARICAKAAISAPPDADTGAEIADLATLSGAGPTHLTFYTGQVSIADAFSHSLAGFCFIPRTGKIPAVPATMLEISCPSVSHAFAAAVSLFYPQSSLPLWPQDVAIHPTAELGAHVKLAPGAVVGPGAAIGEGTILGPGCSIGRGVLIGRDCEIGSNASISYSYIGDRVTIFPGAQIGQPGFGFASGPEGHVKIPQIGRVIIQDEVEIGACTTVDRGGLADTVIGEGTKIDNLVQIGHNVHIGRHCLIAGQTGIAGSCVLEDFVVMGGQVGLGDHSRIGAGARLAARTGTSPNVYLAGGVDYGGAPAKPIRVWARELHTIAKLSRQRKRDDHD